jgi:ankyrin repeat protein
MVNIDLLLKNTIYEPNLLLEIDSYNNDISDNCEIFLIQRNLSKNIEKALIQECKAGNFKNIKYLVEKKNANIRANNDLALCKASEYGHLKIVENKADIHADYEYFFRWASRNGHLAVVEFLFKRGANIHARGEQAFICASERGHLNVVEYLFKNGANIHAYCEISS